MHLHSDEVEDHTIPDERDPSAGRARRLLASLGSTRAAVADSLWSDRPRRVNALVDWLRVRMPQAETADLDVPSLGRLRLLRPDGRLIEVRLPAAVRDFLRRRRA